MPPRDLLPRVSDTPDSRGWRAAVAAAGAVLVGCGAPALAAWAAGAVEYVRIDPAAPPLHYNGAAGFVAWGLGLAAVAAGRFAAARALGVAVAALGILMLAANAPELGFRLDAWAGPPPAGCPPLPPAGDAPGVAGALVLGGLALVVAGRRRVTARRTLALTLVGAALAAAGAAGLVSVGAVVVAADHVIRMSVLGGVGVAAGGLALLASPLRRGAAARVIPALLPAAVAVVGLVLTVALWAGLSAEQDARVGRQAQFEAAQAQRAVRDLLAGNVAALERGARDWPGPDPTDLTERAGAYVGQTPGCVGVAWVGGDLGVRWVESRRAVPLPTTLAGLGADAAAAGVRAGRVAVVRPPRSVWAGARVLVVYAPADPANPGGGGVLAVYLLREFLAGALNENVAAGYAVAVADGGDEVFGRYAAGPAGRDRWAQALPVAFADRAWRVTVRPTPDALARENLSLPRVAALAGAFATALLALAVHLALTARRRAAALETEARERERAQLALTASEGKYRTLIENLNQGVFLLDRDQRFVAANPEFCRGLGRAEAEVVGRTPAELFDPRRAARHAEDARAVLADGKSVDAEDDHTADGRRTVVRRVLTPVRDAAGQTTGVLGIVWDVTQQRLLEAQVHQSSKMDAIGQLAGGIAHDFNNLLTGILGNLELILAGAADGPTRELAGAAQNAATRAAQLTKRLLGFARRHQLDWVPTDPAAMVEEVVTLLRRTIDPLVRIDTRCPADTWLVQADPAQLNQVLMNLCLNARDAIAGAGTITVETACLSAAEVPAGHAGRGGDYVRLSVADTGAGMTDDVKARIYEPFFTTKGVGKGTGLGLPTAFAAVRQHGGWIDCWSQVGRGTRFDVYLPRAAPGARAPAPRDATPLPQRLGRERVLVVDDEAMIRRVAVMALQGRGYRVVEAADGQQAVDVYARERDRIDLVLLDLSMPVLSGHETFRLLLQLDPRVRVLFASGYSAEQLSDLEREMMAGFVSKPYRPTELVAAVEAALRPGSRERAAATA